jgi:hypothetical protein
VHTSNRNFVADIAGENDYGVPTRLRIYRGKLG